MVQDSGQLVLGEEPRTSSFFGNAGAQYLLVCLHLWLEIVKVVL
jgi:hypothetical protein